MSKSAPKAAKQSCLPILLAVPLLSFIFGPTVFAQDKIDFGSQIKPILSDNCFACHGPDEAQRTTDFRLDQKESALSSDYGIIVPTDPGSSVLVDRILSEDPDEVMPPADHRKSLTHAQKKLIVQWIKEGANWSEHWAFKRPTASKAPGYVDSNWPKHEVDNFILAKLTSQNIKPSPAAEPGTLLRRLNFDLTGLPPSPDDVKRFRSEIQNGGFEKAFHAEVERLLASPHFGERMAVYWLDLVRYADTVGYHGDQNVSVSPYRDYVIEAFNSNMPFDQFTREQLAGDLLDNATLDQKIASGYNRLGMMSAEGGVQPEEYLNKYASDRVRTTASVWLGVTLGCAECHDHKFDAFTTKEFYEFAAFFADIKERGLYAGANRDGKWGPSIDVADETLPDLLKPIDEEISQLKSRMVETDQIRAEQRLWEKSLSDAQAKWKSLAPIKVTTRPTLATSIADDHSILITGENPKHAFYGIELDVDKDTKAFRLEALPHESLPKNGPGRAGNGNFVVSELIILRGAHADQLKALRNPESKWTEALKSNVIKLANATATIEQTFGGEGHPDKKWSAASTIDKDKHGKTWGWAILPDVGKPQELVVQIADGETVSDKVTIVIRQQHENGPHLLGHFRLSQTTDQNATADPARSLAPNLLAVVQTEKAERTPEQKKLITDHFISIAPAFEQTRKRIAELQKQKSETESAHTRPTLVTVAVPPRQIRVLARGNWMDKSGEVVEPSVPGVLGGAEWEKANLKNGRASRLDLANWIVDSQNPLTARVFVNRTWRMFFGSGISNVLDDLGSQGEPPSHPELLDSLAVKFVESGWNVKDLIREIVGSSTYQQSSKLRGDLKELDPENRLLARQSRFRLEAEFIRDHALSVSNLLVRKTGGKSVMPYQPPGLYRHLNFPTRKYSPSSGEDQYRRGLYTHWQRQFLHPAMKTFDAPSREECTAARPRSSTPLAALVLLNDPSYVEAAVSLADLALKNASDSPSRIELIFERAFSRSPTAEEVAVLSELFESHSAYFSNHAAEAKKLIAIGQSSKSNVEVADSATHAAWTSVCRAVFNMHEFVLRK